FNRTPILWNCNMTCHKDARCEIRGGTTGCYCSQGFTGNGITICKDDNECENATQPCGEHANCTNTEGSYYCTCAPGFKPSNGQQSFVPNDGTSCVGKLLLPARQLHIVTLLLLLLLITEIQQIVFIFVNVSASNLVLVNTVNNFVQKDKITVWEALPVDNQRRSLTKLLHTTEQATLLMSQSFKKTTQLDANASDIALKVFAFDSHHMKHIHPHVHTGGDYIKISPKKRREPYPNGTVAVVFLRYSNIGSLLSSPKNLSKDAAEPRHTVSSAVIAVAISSNPPTLYELEKITFTLKYAKGGANYNILTRITQLGIIISLICLSMCIFTFWFFSEIQSTRTTIHKNLCCSLFLAELIFLIGINMNNNKLFCSITAGLLHYFLLAAFAWMCIEGIHLYLIVVGVIYNKGFLHKNFYVFGYVSPAVVVGISAALGYKYYGTTEVCWLSTKNNFIWSFIGPACLIILVNLLAFGVIIYKVFRHTAMLKPEVSCYENIRSCARGALALLFLLGATWIFGVLHVVQGSVVTAYLFTIFNAFQGMFIFIFLCVLSRKIQEEYYRLFKNVPCCFGCLR
uniref:Adhesion G protein-coupled receptor L4 n=1 Tax=Malurus cyaneus samueli TaxID=2593467 RepID=A0A8C5U2S6_9PASS